jgi:hypothetical protein
MRDADGNPMFTKGVWKSVSAVAVPSASAVITHVTPLVYYTGAGWPTTPLSNGNATFDVVVKVFLLAPTAGVSGLVEVSGEWSGGGIQQVVVPALPAGVETGFNVTIHATGPDLWWPNGMGAQSLYDAQPTFPSSKQTVAEMSNIAQPCSPHTWLFFFYVLTNICEQRVRFAGSVGLCFEFFVAGHHDAHINAFRTAVCHFELHSRSPPHISNAHRWRHCL